MKKPSGSEVSKGKTADFLYYMALYFVALFGSVPLLTSSSPVPPGFDSVMHLSKIRIFSELFPQIPRWFPWWYCGTPSIRFYPPSSYLAATLIAWLSQTSVIEAYGLTDLFAFYLAGLALYLFMKSLGFSRISSFSSAVFYMLSPQTLYSRFFVGQFTHDVSMFLVPLTFFLIIKFGKDVKKLALAIAPFFALLFLTHLQTALSFGFMMIIYLLSNAILWVKGVDRQSINIHMQGIILGGALGVPLSSFWLLPSLLEGARMLGLSVDVAKSFMRPFETIFVDAANLSYLDPLQRIWSRQFFLGYPIVIFAFLALALIVLKKFSWKKRSWGIIFASWAAIFLFGVVSPNIGLVLGWPNRLPYFVAMPMAMLAGLFVDWAAERLLPSSANMRSPRMIVACLVLAILVLSPFVHAYNFDQFIYVPYADEIEALEHLETLGSDPTERVASFGTFSYVYNVFSDGWQLDGGYVQGQVNPDFYYRYWITLETGNLESVPKTLDETNTRYVIFQKGTGTHSIYENLEYFEKSETSKFTIYKLKDAYELDFITVTSGQAAVTYAYLNPDELKISARYCSNNVSLTVKMNYYQGWLAQATNGTVTLTKDFNGLMKLDVSNAASLEIILSYGLTQNDYAGMVITIVGAVTYIFILLATIWKPNER